MGQHIQAMLCQCQFVCVIEYSIPSFFYLPFGELTVSVEKKLDIINAKEIEL